MSSKKMKAAKACSSLYRKHLAAGGGTRVKENILYITVAAYVYLF